MCGFKVFRDPESLGFSSKNLGKAYEILGQAVKEGRIMGASIQVARSHGFLEPITFGRRGLEPDAPLVESNTIFLTASVTKPITATAVMKLIEDGKLCLRDHVTAIIPEFIGKWKEEVLVRHLLTHTSGLPDMLPENAELRRRHADLDEFLQRIYRVPLLFEPGTNISYQSCGFALLGEIVKRLTGIPLAEFMRQEIFKLLGMEDSSLGVDWRKVSQVSQVNIPKGSFEYGSLSDDWNWNSPYWWGFAAPWGGMFSTASDLTRFLMMFLNEGRLGSSRVLSPRTVRIMTSNQTILMPLIKDDVKRSNPWGLGWRLKAYCSLDWGFGDLASSRTFGHTGATGTMIWADPETNLACTVLTNQPDIDRCILSRFSNALVASVIES
ncbi:beta-lactamase family protein [Candidatus Bathyarchaeota archaeon]|nr:beta-lactamase family protein [Candidatus Bathyarchaeota archaeon]